MIKRVISLFLSVLFVFTLIPINLINTTATSVDSCGQNATWKYDFETKTLIISGTGAIENYIRKYDESKIDSVQGYYTNAPWWCYREVAENLVIEEGITSIGSWSFYQFRNIQSVILPKSLTKINERAFHCFNGSFKEIVFPEGLKEIGEYAFDGSDIERLEIPGSLKIISLGAFHCCDDLKEVIIKDGCTTIGAYAFNNCIYLSNITIPATVKNIGSYALCRQNPIEGWYAYSGYKGLCIYGEKDSYAKKYASNNDISFVSLTDTNNLLEYPVYNSVEFKHLLKNWVENSSYQEMFSVYLDMGYTYEDILEMTIDLPVAVDLQNAYSIESTVKVKDVMAYLVFADLVQDYMSKVIQEVQQLISAGKTSDAYELFLDRIKNFNLQYFYFQDSVNGGDAFNQTLYSLLLLKTAFSIVDGLEVTYTTGEKKYVLYGTDDYYYVINNPDKIKSSISLKSYSYVTNLYKANVSETPEYYDDLYYFILSGGDTSYLNSYYEQTLKGYSLAIKDTKELFKIAKKGEADTSSLIGLGIDNLSYFAERFEWEGSDTIKNSKKAWKIADTAKDIICSISNGSVVGLAGTLWNTVNEEYIDKVKEIYEKAEKTEAGWYALAYYYLGKENPKALKAIVNPDTGAVTFSSNTVNSMALYGVPFNKNDAIQKNLQIFYENNLWSKNNFYSPDKEFKFYLWNSCNVAINITKINCSEYRDILLEYIIAEMNLEHGNAGVYVDVSVSANNSSLGSVVGGGIFSVGDKTTIKALPNKNVTFLGWKNIDTGEMLSNNLSYTITIKKEICLEAVFESGEVIVPEVPVVQNQPQDAEYYRGQESQPLSFDVYVSDDSNLTVEWYKNISNSNKNGILVGSGNAYTPKTTEEGVAYYYACIINSINGKSSMVKTSVAKVEVTAPIVTGFAITSKPTVISYFPGDQFIKTGMDVKLQYSDGMAVSVTDYDIDYDFSTVGEKVVTISYLGFVDYINVVVDTVLSGELSNGIKWKVDSTSKELHIYGEGTVLTELYNRVNYYITHIEKITFSEDITEIESGAFRNLSYLSNVQLPNSLIKIGEYAFMKCTSLNRIVLPKTVASIGNNAFLDCSALETVYYTGTGSEWNATNVGTSGNDLLCNATFYFNCAYGENVDMGTDFTAQILIDNKTKALGLSGVSSTIVQPNENHRGQLYYFVRQADGSYRIINAKTRLVLGLWGEKEVGTPLCIFSEALNDFTWIVQFQSEKCILKPAGTENLAVGISNGKVQLVESTENVLNTVFTVNKIGSADYEVYKKSENGVLTEDEISTINNLLCEVSDECKNADTIELSQKISEYASKSFELGVTEIRTIAFCVNIIFIGGDSELERVLSKTNDYSLDSIYAAVLTDAGTQVGSHKMRNWSFYKGCVLLS